MTVNTEHSITRDDVLLLVAKGAEDAPYPLDAIRTMKSAFIVSQRGLPAWRELFEFEPYDYGPFDSSVYRTRDALLVEGLLERSGPYDAVRLTLEGQARVTNLEEQIGGNADWLKRIGRWASSRSFAQLLREVYAEYPKFAANSVARIA
jgi:hypothetical protein